MASVPCSRGECGTNHKHICPGSQRDSGRSGAAGKISKTTPCKVAGCRRGCRGRCCGEFAWASRLRLKPRRRGLPLQALRQRPFFIFGARGDGSCVRRDDPLKGGARPRPSMCGSTVPASGAGSAVKISKTTPCKVADYRRGGSAGVAVAARLMRCGDTLPSRKGRALGLEMEGLNSGKGGIFAAAPVTAPSPPAGEGLRGACNKPCRVRGRALRRPLPWPVSPARGVALSRIRPKADAGDNRKEGTAKDGSVSGAIPANPHPSRPNWRFSSCLARCRRSRWVLGRFLPARLM